MAPPSRAIARLARVAREPMFHFLAIGVALFAAYALLEPRSSEPIRLAAATRAALIAEFEAVTGAPAGAEAVARLERDYITEELLYRDALAEGLHLSDGAVRERLVEQRRRNITDGFPEPGDEDLVNFYAENVSLYRSEPAASFEHVFFASLPQDSTVLVARLRAGRAVGGDTSRFGTEFSRYGISMLRGLYGQDFVAALWEAPRAEWSGPIRSSEGWHFVKPAERLPPEQLPFAAVREQVAHDFMAARAREAIDRHRAELERRYDIVIER
jgi:peptidyl-prolyl cis-trans isomerase C